MSFLGIFKKQLHQNSLEEVSNADKDIREVETLPVFNGKISKYSTWKGFGVIPVNLKNLWFIESRIDDANEKRKTEVFPSEFQGAWEELVWYMTRMIKIENKIKWKSKKPSRVYEDMKRQYTKDVCDFLDRYYKRHIDNRIRPLKTVKGKMNRSEEFLSKLDILWDNMTEDARQYAKQLNEKQIELINKGKL